MRSTLKLMAPLAALAGLCATGYSDHHEKPVDITGVWKVVATSESGEMNITWTIRKEGDQLAGTSTNDENGEETQLDRIKVEKNKVTIEVDIERDGNKGIIKVAAEGKEPGRLTGKWTVEDLAGTEFMSGELVAEKEIAVAFAGTWQATSIRPNGEELRSVMILTGGNADLAGMIKRNEREFELTEATATTGSLQVAFSFKMQDDTIPIVIKAKLDGEDKLVGKWAIPGPDGAEVMSNSWSAVRETLAGTWNVNAALPDNGEYTGTMTLKKNGKTFEGRTRGSDGDEQILEKIKVDGRKLTFSVPFESDDFEGAVMIEAKQEESGALKGTWSLNDLNGNQVAGDSWSATRQAEEE